MALALFVSDLHGHRGRYRALFELIVAERPAAVFLGGDLLPHPLSSRRRQGTPDQDFIDEVLLAGCEQVAMRLGREMPAVFLIPGNDDARADEPGLLEGDRRGLWRCAHGRRLEWREWVVYGYACVPPTPFLLKDWERYDVSRHVPPGCVDPNDGWRTAPGPGGQPTIHDELSALLGDDQERAIWLVHTPPYDTPLDRAALDGRSIDAVPLDVHVGSIAVRRLIETRQPRVSLHGHIHEAVRLTGCWQVRLGDTYAFQAAHDGPELAVVRFDPERPADATRTLYAVR